MKFQKSIFIVIAFIGISLIEDYGNAQTLDECNSEIFCQGELLHSVQMNSVFPDSKTFVDMSLKPGVEPGKVMEEFAKVTDRENVTVLKKFVEDWFQEGAEFEDWKPADYIENPEFLSRINDLELRSWAKALHTFWDVLGRKIKEEVAEQPERFSMIYVKNGVIVPGGRFKEFYYWDSYWIQIGLLHSEMKNTTRGMLENFLEMVDKFGFVPNGGRIYFTRSQPPLLIPMFKQYMDATNDTKFLSDNIHLLDKEFQFWIDNRTLEVNSGDKKYTMARYNSEMEVPRPESYKEDFELAEHLPDHEKFQLYSDLHAGAESGWDFSSRWWVKNESETGHLKHTKTTNVVPVDLNSILYLNAKTLAQFHESLNQDASYYDNWANEFKVAIEEVLWNEVEGCWFDYDHVKEEQRIEFYQSNIMPLWAGVNDDKSKEVYQYLLKSRSLDYVGGVPTSVLQTGEQWDFPNGWAPLQHFFVDTLSRFEESKEMAFVIAKNWIYGNYKAYLKAEKMFEKYDVTYQGLPGGGGEYEVVVGFGWSNGVVLDFLSRYGDRLVAPHIAGSSQLSPLTSTTLALGSISILISSYWGVRRIKRRCFDKIHRHSNLSHNNTSESGSDKPFRFFCYGQSDDHGSGPPPVSLKEEEELLDNTSGELGNYLIHCENQPISMLAQ